MDRQSGLHAAMRSRRPPDPEMYRIVGTLGCVLRKSARIREVYGAANVSKSRGDKCDAQESNN